MNNVLNITDYPHLIALNMGLTPPPPPLPDRFITPEQQAAIRKKNIRKDNAFTIKTYGVKK